MLTPKANNNCPREIKPVKEIRQIRTPNLSTKYPPKNGRMTFGTLNNNNNNNNTKNNKIIK